LLHTEAMLALLILIVQVAPALSAEDHHDHDEHAHSGEVAFEWAGIFETPESVYLWTAQKVEKNGVMQYADNTMKLAVLPAAAATEDKLHLLETEGTHSLNANCVNVTSGGIITPEEDKCYNLHFKQDWWQSLYSIDTTGHAAVAFFAQHVPTEFENTAHYLKDDHGDDIEPVAELPEVTTVAPTATGTDEEDYWGVGVGTAILVNIVTLVGVIFLVPALSKAVKSYAGEFECVMSGFAAGAISACAFFLLLFESTHLIAEDHSEEVDQIWRWGIMILSGALFPIIAHLIVELITNMKQTAQSKASDAEQGAEQGDKTSETVPFISRAARARLISGILIGDFVHNLCDGFFIAAAFKGCGSSFGWTVASSTIAHEIAQELSDYVVLTGKDCRLKPLVALALNFLSGTGVLLGVIIVLANEVGNGDIGLLLAFGGGTYLYIAFVECMPKLMSDGVSALTRALAIFMFMIGAIAIGLVLLDHEHCVPPAAPGAPPKPAGHHHH
jgi:zinc transporter ZupT